jgi:hypothetical protein
MTGGRVGPGPTVRSAEAGSPVADSYILKHSSEVAMSGITAKQKVLEAIEKLPPDATVEDAIERLVLLAKIERGLAELDAGQGIEHGEARRRLIH